MAVGELVIPEIFPVAGVRLAVASAGIKKPGRKDMVLLELAAGANSAGVFTKNLFCAAPVQLAKQHLQAGMPRYLLVNTGNANAGTGAAGLKAAVDCCTALARQCGVAVEQVLPFSTGVIGEPLPADKVIASLPALQQALAENNWEAAASGILTTDTRPKISSRRITIQGRAIAITGIAKGAGMIKPNMATMLAYIATDVGIAPALLQQLAREATDSSFNRITVDGDTSTNDACMLVATGMSGLQLDQQADGFSDFRDALFSVFIELAQAVVRDGEGATKFVTVAVNGGANEQECLRVGYAVAESPLVKTALFASDPNWGRILAAIGRAGVDALQVDRVRICLNDTCIVEHGGRSPGYTEAQGQAVMKSEEITIDIELGMGDHSLKIWTTDLGYDYVKINAEYRS